MSDLPASYVLECPSEEDDLVEEGLVEKEGSGSDGEDEEEDSDSQI